MRKIKRFTSALAFCLVLGGTCIPSSLSEIQAASPDTVAEDSVTRSDIIQWRFKTVNGKLYRRLYNYSTGEWIGEWEFIR